MSIPHWLSGDVVDVRRLVGRWIEKHTDPTKKPKPQVHADRFHTCLRAHTLRLLQQSTFLPITRQLHVLGLAPFEGRQHCGIDVSTCPLPFHSHTCPRPSSHLGLNMPSDFHLSSHRTPVTLLGL